MDEVDSKAQREYEHKLEEALIDFRKQHEMEMKRYREEMEIIYESKVGITPQTIHCVSILLLASI